MKNNRMTFKRLLFVELIVYLVMGVILNFVVGYEFPKLFYGNQITWFTLIVCFAYWLITLISEAVHDKNN